METLFSFHQVRYLAEFLVHARTGHCQQLVLSLQDFQTLPQKVGTENRLTWSKRNVCKNVSSRPTGLSSRFCWNDSPLFTTGTQLLSQSLLSHTLCRRLERFSTANNLSHLWCSKLQHVTTYAFFCWDYIFTQKGNCCSPNNLCESPKSPSLCLPTPL